MEVKGIPFGPPRASNFASEVDALFLFELAIAAFFIFGILVTIIYFVLRYRRRSEDEIPASTGKHYGIEITWTVIPLALMMVMYFWGADLFVRMKRPIANGLEIHVLGKQWMWKFEHAEGVREIDTLHIPVNQPIKLILASQDVIHDFFVPAFRIKQDVVPGSYVTEWFQATRTGEYHFFCSQYCGTDHSQMIGTVVVLEPAEYQAWLAGAIPTESPAAAGQKLFTTYGCTVCHGQRSPTMAGLYQRKVQLQDGRIIVADDNYIRRSIIDPSADIVAGFPAVMPSFRGQLSEEQLFQLLSYIKSLKVVRNVEPPGALVAPATQPAPGDQPSVVPNFPPAETPYPIQPPIKPNREPGIPYPQNTPAPNRG